MNHWMKSIVSLAFLLLMLAFAYLATQAPTARSDSEVDYTALTTHVAKIAARPHHMGSAANREVRDYIVQYFESLGLETEIQKTTVVFRHPFRARSPTIIGNVENIFARLPGTGEGVGDNQDLVLMSHYDSRADGPGAGDDASGTASIMETARILAMGPAPRHDVVFLITDGEEMGLLGAQGFFRQHPAAQQIGLVLNFEARGSYGTSSMFETSEGNSWLIDNLLRSAPDLVADSLSYEIYKRMPNDTDMSITKGEGIAGLNFAFLSGLHDYHSMGDTPENLDPDTLAQQANYVLATARHFSNLGEWPEASSQASAGSKTYFNLWNGTLVSYSEGVATIIGLVVLLVGLWLFVSALRSAVISFGSLGLGVLALLVLLVMVSNVFESLIDYMRTADAGIAHLVSLGEQPFFAYLLLTLGIVLWFAGAIRRGMTKTEAIAPILIVAGLSVLAGRGWLGALLLPVIFIPVLLYIRSRKTKPSLWGAALLTWWVLTALILLTAPNTSYVFVWPLAVVMLGIILRRKAGSGVDDGFTSTNIVVAIFPLLLLLPVLIRTYLALGTGFPQGVMMLSVLVLLLLWPLIRDIGRPANGLPAYLLLAAGLIFTSFIVFDRSFDARHQRGEEIFYAIDVKQQQGFWISSDVRPGSWLDDFMGDDTRPFNIENILPGFDQDAVMRETVLPEIDAAILNVVSDEIIAGQRQLGLYLRSPLKAEYINLLFARDVSISAASVNGFKLTLPEEQQEQTMPSEKADSMKEPDTNPSRDWWRWRWYGLPDGGANIVLTIEPGKSLSVRVIEVDYGTPEGAPARPEASMPKSYRWSDSMVIFQTVVVD
jgi:hypothetical protein